MNEIVTREAPVTRATDGPALSVTGERLTGYAVVYGQQTAAPVRIGRSWLPEIIDAGAFDLSLTRNVAFTFDHQQTAEYGDTASGTLRLKSDATGIGFELDLPSYAQTLRGEIESGAITGMSFGFVPQQIEVRDGVRHVVKAELLHISPVYSPAYPQRVPLPRSPSLRCNCRCFGFSRPVTHLFREWLSV